MEPDLLLRTDPYFPVFGSIKSDKSRTAGGILQIIIPGVGRMYLGYSAIGVLQLLLSFCAGVGWLWSVIDGIIILAGGVKMDGYGRYLTD
jgi:TM2 domain-containing membrane protein YozV